MPGQTGPTTRNGKATSSQNARKHGMRSKTVIIGDEKQEDFDRLAAGWRAEYDDDGQATKSLLERVILNDWFLQRAERRYMELECELAAVDALEWTEEDHKKIELYLRYKTTNERSFYRALNALRGLRKDKIREVMDFKKMEKRAEEAVEKALEKKSAEREAKPEAKAASAAAISRDSKNAVETLKFEEACNNGSELSRNSKLSTILSNEPRFIASRVRQEEERVPSHHRNP
jgi:hypothetical protein